MIAAGAFLQELWRGYSGDGLVTLMGSQKQVFGHLPASDLAEWDADDESFFAPRDVWTSPTLRPPDISPTKAGVRRGLVAIAAFALDLDIATEGHHKSDRLPTTFEDAAKIVDAGPEPTFVIHTGGGLHLWWLFPPIDLIDFADRQRAQRVSERFHKTFHQAAEHHGFHLDNTAGIERRFRLPGTTNTKRGAKPIEVLYRTDARYSYDELAKALDGRRIQVPSPPTSSNLDDDEAVVDPTAFFSSAIPSIAAARDAILNVAKRVRPDHQHKDKFERILAGKSFAPSGERDLAMFETVSTLIFSLDRKISIDDAGPALIEIYRPSFEVWAKEPGATKTIDERIEKFAWKIQAAFEQRADKDAEKAKTAEIVRRGLRFAGGEAAEDAVPSWTLDKFTVIQYRNHFFLYSFGWQANPDAIGYMGPFVREEIVAQARARWENAPALFSANYINAKGEEKERPVNNLVAEYGTAALDVIGHLVLQESFYDVATGHFHRAFCPFRITEARFDKNIDTWLRLMGGDQQEKLLDWIAAVPQLDRQNCALYLEGPPAIGKSSLLALGLSKLWRTTGPSHFANLMAGFNADMFSCPLILLDEGLPRSASHTSAFIRSLIGSSEHTFNQKNQPMHKVLGNIRMIIAANDDSVLSQLSNEEMGEQSLEAVAGRFLHIVGQREAAEWIRDQNAVDRSVIDSWVQDDLIAKHALWLSQNRVITPGKRFLVEGAATDMHRSLITRGEKQGLVLEWLCRFMLDPGRVERDLKIKKQDDLVQLGNGHLYINTQVVVENWSIFRMPELKLTPTMIGRTLTRLSHGQRRLGTRSERSRYHDINFENVRRIAEDLQLDVALMEENLNRPLDNDAPPGTPINTFSSELASA